MAIVSSGLIRSLISKARCTPRKSDAWSFSRLTRRHSRLIPSQGLVRHMALNPLINSEIEAAAGKEHRDSAISTDNYSLNLLGEQQLGPYRCFVAEAVPKRRDKYLFEGRVWIDVNDYSVVRIEGHPARKLSFWIQHADFVRQYQTIDGFWLPERDQTLVQVRLHGKKILQIEHWNYVVNEGQSTNERSAVRETTVTQKLAQTARDESAE